MPEETIELRLNKQLLSEIDEFVQKGLYVNRYEFVRAAVRAYVESENERLFSGKEKEFSVKIDAETAMKLDDFCNETGLDYRTVISKALNAYKPRNEEDYLPYAFALFDKLLE